MCFFLLANQQFYSRNDRLFLAVNSGHMFMPDNSGCRVFSCGRDLEVFNVRLFTCEVDSKSRC